jgi:hypothetical protein
MDSLLMGNGLVPALPVAGFNVGDSFEVPCFDPISMGCSPAQVKVLSQSKYDSDGLAVDAFILETEFKGMKSKSWVTASGELLRQEFGPPLEDIVLRHESRDSARRFFRR